MSIELSAVETTVLHTSVERIAGLISASIAHHQREGARELADLYQVALEDVVRIRDILGAKGVSTRPKVAPPIARSIGEGALRSVFDRAPAIDLDPPNAESAA